MRKTMILLMGTALSIGIGFNYGCQLGVTQGGAQDIGLARDVIQNGEIPYLEQFTVEGLFSEHDLPLSGEDCQEVLCPRYGVAMFSPIQGGDREMLVQVGFGTKITADAFQRRNLHVSLVVDVSGSMGGDKISIMKDALLTLSHQLHSGDRVSLIAFDDSPEIRMEMQHMNEVGLAKLRDEIRNLRPQGGTNIEGGMRLGYRTITPQMANEDMEHRLMLFTDANPNIGATGIDSFLGMARHYASSGVGISVFGVGLDLGSELTSEVSKTRGGNSFYLGNEEANTKIFDEEFAYIVSPIGYDFEVNVELTTDVEMNEIYGSTTDVDSLGFSFGASTLFLSSRTGGIGVTLKGVDVPLEKLEPKFVSVDLRYKTLDLEPKEELIYI